MDLIDRHVLIERIHRQREHLNPSEDARDYIGDAAYRICIEIVERLPSAEPEIIYCKDCDQYNPEAQFCDLVQFNFLPEGHCSWGRRKGRK